MAMIQGFHVNDNRTMMPVEKTMGRRAAALEAVVLQAVHQQAARRQAVQEQAARRQQYTSEPRGRWRGKTRILHCAYPLPCLSYRFYTHFHPYVNELLSRLAEGSLAGMLETDTLTAPRTARPPIAV